MAVQIPAPKLPAELPAAHALIESLSSELQRARWQIDALKKELYGASSDRVANTEPVVSEQNLLGLFDASSEAVATENVVTSDEEPKESVAEKGRPVRRSVPQSLDTVVRRIEPADKICPLCGEERCEIGCERCERIEYIPAKLIREEIVRPKLACKKCPEAGVVIAPVPPAVVEKGRYGAGLITQVVLAKYDEHQPLDRQSKHFQRLGVGIPRQTLSDLVEKAADLLQPVVTLMKQELLVGNYVQVDETPVRVLDPEIKGQSTQGYLWVLGRPHGNVVFEFHPGRGREFAEKLLGDFKGILQRDGYGVYGAIAKDRPDIISAGCLAHGRRKFIDAQADEPVHSVHVLRLIRRLYALERVARDENLRPEDRLLLRQSHAPPIWTELKEYLDKVGPKALPQSPFAKAVRYAQSEWATWQTYLQDGRVEIDNNLTENAIRPTALGRKNWLFIGHPQAGWRSAVIYSIITSCRRHSIDPWSYMADALLGIASATNHTLGQWTPSAWAARHITSAVKEPVA